MVETDPSPFYLLLVKNYIVLLLFHQDPLSWWG